MCVYVFTVSNLPPVGCSCYTSSIIEEQLFSVLTVCMVGANRFVPRSTYFGVFQCRLNKRKSLALRAEAYEEVPETVAAVPRLVT